MNIEQYRALKAEEEAAKNQPQVEQTVAVPETVPTVDETKPDSPKETTQETKPDVIEIDGKEVTIDELKNGYLRQSDYTKKTQEVARQREETKQAIEFYENLKKNPQIVEQIKQSVPVPPQMDASTAKVIELENKMYDMMLEREIEVLQNKYNDFEIREVLELASNKGMTNLEDAYLLLKSQKPNAGQTVDVNKMKEDLRKEILKELQEEKDVTRSVITKNSTSQVPQVNVKEISESEKRVASMMGLTNDEYIKWRDIDKKK